MKKVIVAGIILLAMWAAEMLRTDYGGRGVLLIAVYYMMRSWPEAKALMCDLKYNNESLYRRYRHQ